MSKEIVAELKAASFELPLKPYQRDVMLDLILAWGTLDGALSQLVAAFSAEPLCVTVERIGKSNGSAKIREIVDLLKSDERTKEKSKTFKRIKRKYEKYSVARNRIAHGHCAGYLSCDEQYLVFAVAEREGEDELAVEAIPLAQMIAATNFGNELAAISIEIVKEFEQFRAT